MSVDVREKQEGVSTGLVRHRTPYSSMGGHGPSSSKRWFEVRHPLGVYIICLIVVPEVHIYLKREYCRT